MNWFDDRENRRAVLIWFITGFVMELVAIRQSSECGLMVFFVLLIYGVLLYRLITLRHRRLEKLANSVDRVLNNNEIIMFDHLEEGDFAVLQSEIQKMTVKLRKHDNLIRKEKIYLQDSIADISHQLRTPLTTINLLMNFIKDPNLEEGKKRKYIIEITHHLDRLDWLISSLLKISKIDAGTAVFKKEKVKVSELIAKAVEPILISLEIRNQTFEFISFGNESFTGDINWTCEAFSNIFKNCMEHTQEGGRISIRARETVLFTEIDIQDNGPGISPEDLPHLFERFYKGKASQGANVGIGLALGQMIIHSQNGTLKAQNSPEGGAVFTVRFYKEVKNGSIES